MNGTVLIVEDNLETRRVLREYFEALSWVVSEAINGRAAMDSLAQSSFDLVVSDLRMPEADGFSLLSFVRENTKSKFVLMSGFVGTEEVAKARRMGANTCLSKPFTMADLTRALGEP